MPYRPPYCTRLREHYAPPSIISSRASRREQWHSCHRISPCFLLLCALSARSRAKYTSRRLTTLSALSRVVDQSEPAMPATTRAKLSSSTTKPVDRSPLVGRVACSEAEGRRLALTALTKRIELRGAVPRLTGGPRVAKETTRARVRGCGRRARYARSELDHPDNG